MNRRLLIPIVIFAWLAVTLALSYGALTYRKDIHARWDGAVSYAADVKEGAFSAVDQAGASAIEKIDETGRGIIEFKDNTVSGIVGFKDRTFQSITDFKNNVVSSAANFVASTANFVVSGVSSAADAVSSSFDWLRGEEKGYSVAHERRKAGMINAAYDMEMDPPLTLSEIKRRKQEQMLADYNALQPAAGEPAWVPDQPSITAEAVLVPRQVTVISSSQDGRIAEIPVGHGDSFKKGDILIAYDCTDVEAEAEIARAQKDLTKRKVDGTNKLFKLDIISDLDRLGAEVEDKQANAKARAYDARMQDCQIRARFDGRVTNRLANPGEYTRTDRVLLEVASDEPLQAEFLVPSKWLRWVNAGAPVSITIGETEKTYTAKIRSIHGEVDPVSQSIQMVATLDPYNDVLLPGMSGQVTIDVDTVRKAGIKGYLEAGYTPQR